MNEMVQVMKGGIMPIKDLAKRREYQRELMRKKRQGLTVSPVSPGLDLNLKVSPGVSPNNSVRPTTVSPVRPQQEMLDRIRPMENVKPMIELIKLCSNCPRLEKQIKELQSAKCPRNHHSLTDLFQQAREQVQQS
jgi:hypothetical protein